MTKAIKRLSPSAFFHDPKWVQLLDNSKNKLFTFDFEGYTLTVDRNSKQGLTIKNGSLVLVLRMPYWVWVTDSNDSATVEEFFGDPSDPTEEEAQSFALCHPKLVPRLEELSRVYHKIIGQMHTLAHLSAFKNNQEEAETNLRRKTEWMTS